MWWEVSPMLKCLVYLCVYCTLALAEPSRYDKQVRRSKRDIVVDAKFVGDALYTPDAKREDIPSPNAETSSTVTDVSKSDNNAASDSRDVKSTIAKTDKPKATGSLLTKKLKSDTSKRTEDGKTKGTPADESTTDVVQSRTNVQKKEEGKDTEDRLTKGPVEDGGSELETAYAKPSMGKRLEEATPEKSSTVALLPSPLHIESRSTIGKSPTHHHKKSAKNSTFNGEKRQLTHHKSSNSKKKHDILGSCGDCINDCRPPCMPTGFTSISSNAATVGNEACGNDDNKGICNEPVCEDQHSCHTPVPHVSCAGCGVGGPNPSMCEDHSCKDHRNCMPGCHVFGNRESPHESVHFHDQEQVPNPSVHLHEQEQVPNLPVHFREQEQVPNPSVHLHEQEQVPNPSVHFREQEQVPNPSVHFHQLERPSVQVHEGNQPHQSVHVHDQGVSSMVSSVHYHEQNQQQRPSVHFHEPDQQNVHHIHIEEPPTFQVDDDNRQDSVPDNGPVGVNENQPVIQAVNHGSGGLNEGHPGFPGLSHIATSIHAGHPPLHGMNLGPVGITGNHPGAMQLPVTPHPAPCSLCEDPCDGQTCHAPSLNTNCPSGCHAPNMINGNAPTEVDCGDASHDPSTHLSNFGRTACSKPAIAAAANQCVGNACNPPANPDNHCTGDACQPSQPGPPNVGCEGESCPADLPDRQCVGELCGEHPTPEAPSNCEGEGCNRDEGPNNDQRCVGDLCHGQMITGCIGNVCHRQMTDPAAATGESCVGESCPESQPTQRCEGEDCPSPIADNPSDSKCVGEDCPSPIADSPSASKCVGEDCPSPIADSPSASKCVGEDCPSPIVDSPSSSKCVGEGCPSQVLDHAPTSTCVGDACQAALGDHADTMITPHDECDKKRTTCQPPVNGGIIKSVDEHCQDPHDCDGSVSGSLPPTHTVHLNDPIPCLGPHCQGIHPMCSDAGCSAPIHVCGGQKCGGVLKHCDNLTCHDPIQICGAHICQPGEESTPVQCEGPDCAHTSLKTVHHHVSSALPQNFPQHVVNPLMQPHGPVVVHPIIHHHKYIIHHVHDYGYADPPVPCQCREQQDELCQCEPPQLPQFSVGDKKSNVSLVANKKSEIHQNNTTENFKPSITVRKSAVDMHSAKSKSKVLQKRSIVAGMKKKRNHKEPMEKVTRKHVVTAHNATINEHTNGVTPLKKQNISTGNATKKTDISTESAVRKQDIEGLDCSSHAPDSGTCGSAISTGSISFSSTAALGNPGSSPNNMMAGCCEEHTSPSTHVEAIGNNAIDLAHHAATFGSSMAGNGLGDGTGGFVGGVNMGGHIGAPGNHHDTTVYKRPSIVVPQPPDIIHRPDIVIHRAPIIIHRRPVIYHQSPVVVHKPPIIVHQAPIIVHPIVHHHRVVTHHVHDYVVDPHAISKDCSCAGESACVCDGNPGISNGNHVDPKLLSNVTGSDDSEGGDQNVGATVDDDVQGDAGHDPGHDYGQEMGHDMDHDCTTAHPCDMGHEITSSPQEMGNEILSHDGQSFPTAVSNIGQEGVDNIGQLGNTVSESDTSQETGDNIVTDSGHDAGTLPSGTECKRSIGSCEGNEGGKKKKRDKINRSNSTISLRELIPHPTEEDRRKLHEALKGKITTKSTLEDSPTNSSADTRRGLFNKPTESSTQTTDKKKKKDVVVSRPPIIYHPPPEIYHRPDIVVHRPPLLIHRPSIIYHQPPVIVHRPAVVYHQPPLVFHQPPPAVQQPLLVSHDTFKMHPSALYTHMGSVVNKVGSYVGVPHGPIVNYPRTPFYGSTGYGPAPGGGYREFGNHHISYANEEDRDVGHEEAPEDGMRHMHMHHEMGHEDAMGRDAMGRDEGGEAPGDEGRGGSPFDGHHDDVMSRMEEHPDDRGMGVGHAPSDFMGHGGPGIGHDNMPESVPDREMRPSEREMRPSEREMRPSEGEGMMPPVSRQHFERDFNGPPEEMGGNEPLGEPPVGRVDRPGRW